MTRFAVIAPPFSSHVRALEALAAELLARGHRVLWVQQADVHASLRDPRIEFAALQGAGFAPGTLARMIANAANPVPPFGLRRVIADMARSTDALCREAPALLRAWRADAVLADAMEAAGALVAAALRLPWISVSCALPVNREPALPLPVMPWGPAGDDAAAIERNAVSTRIYDWLMRPHEAVLRRHAHACGRPELATLEGCLSPLLQLSQTTQAFDFARRAAPTALHHVGPLRAPLGDEAPLALTPPDDARPLVFASLGTLQGGRLGLFRRIARACRALDLQLLVAHCGLLDAAQCKALEAAGARWVVDFAPQRAALARADVAVTHAGLNTVLDALAAGTPILALPVAFDQFGVAARVVHGGAGLRIVPALASVAALRRALLRLLREPSFAERAAALGASVPRGNAGALRAADLIEATLAAGPRPVPIDAAGDATLRPVVHGGA